MNAMRNRLPAQGESAFRTLAEGIGFLAERSLRREVETWPKPGLVSHVDSGSHADMDAALFARSAAAIRPYFVELVEAGMLNADMATLRKIGLRAEHAMMVATQGVNTHRGAIFGMGLLCAAAGLRTAAHIDAAVPLGEAVARRWGDDIMAGPRLTTSHGEMAARQYGAGGARQEAASGFPAIYKIGLPALRAAAVVWPQQPEAARVEACFALIASTEDTNLLHRGGEAGLDFAQRAARRFLDRGGIGAGDWLGFAEAIHRSFVHRRLSPGGSADLLAMTLFVDALEPA